MTVEKLITDHIDIWSSALQTRSTAGRGSNGKIDLYGIKKLRELILELAVRGKLVPQDPSDEPASELLKRIATEKAELVKQGKIKKQKPLPEISEDEKPFELPEGWEFCRLGDATINRDAERVPLSSEERSSRQGQYDYYGASGIIDKIDDFLFDKPLLLIGEDGANLINRTTPIAFIADGRYWVNNHAHVLDGVSEGFLKYVGLCINSINLEQYITGTAQPKMNQAKMNTILLGLAPEKEQQRILSKVDILMSLCDQLSQQSVSSLEAHQQLVETLLATLTDSQNAEELAENWARISRHFDTLFTTEASIDALKQTILQLAVMGKLVPQDPNDEPASELLKRIEEEKAKLVKEGKIKKQKPLPPVSDKEKPFELPKGWEWCRIGEIIANMDAGWSPACSPESSPNENVWGVLKTTAVQRLEYRQQENKTLPSSKLPRPQYEVHDGDILVTRAGPKNRVGVSCLVEKTRSKLMISDKIIRFHLISDEISAKYISLCLNRGVTADYLEASKSGMAESQMNISQENLRSAPIALPPTAIQLKVISTIEDFFKVCDQLKSRLQSAQQTQLHLADALTDVALS
ncbi:restriction endonuclease subunit S [Enterobacter roggenkampii]|uniref:restriction endonuclease subunit S n=1 Tax=Enterobacter roggenkampii TaxID=1812935 RepID=UPI00295C9C86|nr:restriction endonuclease subunit S [Enterobacter roggenkampii]ELT5307597.1 restriction endonuclease subunit S [Enterobacter roggenkampii]EMF1896180.1 restriction endonuclease subunit S [Enterobacter roggenkampii]